MKIALIAFVFLLVFVLLFGGGVYYGWLAQTKIPSDQFYTDLSFTLGILSYVVVVLGVVLIVVRSIFRKK